MDGIMILNTITTPIYSFGWNNWCLLLLIPIFIGIYLIRFWYINRKRLKNRYWAFLGTIFLTISLIIGTCVCATEKVNYDTTYQVIIDNNVDMIQFRSNYEILEQVGITYIIRQK